MSLELEAWSPADGWALVSEAESHYLIRPPYRLAQREKLTAEETHGVVKNLDLRATEGSFAGWPELIGYLRGEMARRADPELLAKSAEASRRILERASREDLNHHLEQLAKRLEGGDWRGTLKAVTVLIGIDAVIDDDGFYQKCRGLLEQCIAVERALARGLASVSIQNRRAWLFSVSKDPDSPGEQLAHAMARRGQVLRIIS